MKKLLLICILTLGYLATRAQKVEFSVQANTGSAFYGGKSAESDSYIIQGQSAEANYTNNPYGTHAGLSYGGGFKLNVVTSKNIMFGFNADYEILKSKVNINGFTYIAVPTTFTTFILLPPPIVNGNTILTSNFINLSPFIGYRLHAGTVSIDLSPGLDIGLGLSSREKGTADVSSGYYGNGTFTTNRSRQKPPTDIRLRFGTSLKYRKVSLNASYADGHSNYMKGMIGNGSPQVYSRIFRFGLGYQLN